MNPRVIQNSIFFAEVEKQIQLGHNVKMRAKGNSMLPFIRHDLDNVVLSEINDNSFKKGSLLLVQVFGDNYILHRLVGTNGDKLILRGDGNLSLTESCSRSNVIAEAVEVERGNKVIVKGSLRWKMYHILWPRNPFMRRVALAAYRRVPLLRR